MISVVVPVYNEEDIVGKNIKEIKEYMGRLHQKWELIIVNDCSSDKTLDELLKIRKNMNNLVVVSHKKNIGPGAAFRTGFKQAKGDIIITNDFDMSFSLRYLPQMLEALKDADVVIGSHHKKGSKMVNVPFIRRMASTCASFLDRNILNVNLSNLSSFFVAYKAEAVKNLEFKANSFDAQCEIIAKLYTKGCRIKDIPCILEWRSDKKRGSSLKLFKEIKRRLILWRRLRKELKAMKNT